MANLADASFTADTAAKTGQSERKVRRDAQRGEEIGAADLSKLVAKGCVGTIARRSGVPTDVDQWEWGCGFYPGTDPGEGFSGTGATFEAARAGFEAAWRIFLPTRTEADFQAWRDQRDWTAWKYAMSDPVMKLPTQVPGGRSRCFCGAEIDIRGLDKHVRDAHRGPVAA